MDVAATESHGRCVVTVPPGGASLAGVIAAAAAAHAGRAALVWGGRTQTYAALLADVSRAAGGIRAVLGRGPATRVVFALEDRREQLIALLASWFAGHAWVPVDPRFPEARQRAIVADADPGLVIAGSPAAAQALAPGRPARTPRALLAAPPVDVPVPLTPDALACILYTSGSTGAPKGVMQTHGALTHHAHKYRDSLGIGPADRLSWLPDVTFAAALTDILGALCSGAALVPFDLRGRGVDGMGAWLAAERVTVYHSVPTVFRRLLETLPDGNALRGLRLVRLSGEVLFPGDVARFRAYAPPACGLVNALGSTELNLIRQYRVPLDAPIATATVPVGHAVRDTEVQILDDALQPVPTGETGEIVVRSRHLSPGYWRQPEATARAFAPDGAGDGWRRFRTGDLGRLAADGCLTHLGRRDERLKIRGVRMEPAEVEAALLRAGGWREAAAVAAGDQLVAYVAPGGGLVSRPAALAEVLPEAMLPARIVGLAELPRLANGKVDRQALAARPLVDAPAPPLAARDDVDLQLAGLWERLFRRRPLDRGADFFALGGQSLLAAELFAAIQRTFDVHLPLATLLRAPTLGALADVIRAGGRTADAWSPLVTVQPLGARPPLYVVPGAGTDVLALRPLAERLAPHGQPLVGIQHQGVRDPRRAQRDIPAMARYYVEHVRRVQPQGPYFLGGLSFGGLIAYEMAAQLRAAGADVPLVLLLDTYAPGYPRRRPNPTLRRRALHLLRACLPLADRETLTWAHFREGLRERCQDARAAVAIRLPRRRAPDPVMRLVWQKLICLRAARGYRLPAFDGRPVLIRAAVQPPEALFLPDPLQGWGGGCATGGIAVIPVPGKHNEVLHAPAVETVVATILARTGVTR